MRRLLIGIACLPLLGLALTWFTPPTAVEPQALSNPTQSRPAEKLIVRPQGNRGPLALIDTGTGQAVFSLPDGILAADGSRFFTAVADAKTTQVTGFDPQTGRPRQQFTFQGAWELSSVSANGRWLTLSEIANDAQQFLMRAAAKWQTNVLVVDSESGQVAHRLMLDGNFVVETVANDGRSLYLVQHLPPINPDHYLIRLYDLEQKALTEAPLRDKRAGDEVMTGYAWNTLASPNGKWLLTLYVNTRRSVAFIHALNVADRFAVCLDLPSGNSDFTQLQQYSLALAPDGRTVYAANPALGALVEINLHDFETKRQIQFDPVPLPADAADMTSISALTPDGDELYVAHGRSVWRYDTHKHTVTEFFQAQTAVGDLVTSADGQGVFLIHKDGSVTAVEAATGTKLSFAK